MNGSSMCVCGSIPPGMTSAPPASTTVVPTGHSSAGPTAAIVPSMHSTSAFVVASAFTTEPPLIRTLLMRFSTPVAGEADASRRRGRQPQRRIRGGARLLVFDALVDDDVVLVH